MFDNIGGKIKGLARFICIGGIIVFAIFGIVIIAGGAKSRMGGATVISGLLTMVFGGVLSWISSLGLYGFGELIEKTTEIANNTRQTQNRYSEVNSTPVFTEAKRPNRTATDASGRITCPNCGLTIAAGFTKCPKCKTDLQ